jgi:hypothetical protein
LVDNTPVLSQFRNVFEDGTKEEIAATGKDIGELALTATTTWADPLGVLIGAGLGFLVTVVKPLNDMLTWVTGDADAIQGHRDDWQTISKDLTVPADGLSKTLAADFAEWNGEASAAARAKLDGFILGVRGTAAEADNIMSLLSLSGA